VLERAEEALTQKQSTPRGKVRISAPTTYGHARVLPSIARFSRGHPAVSIEVNISNRNIDFVAEGYDLAVRMGDLDDSSLVVRKLEDATLGLFASPDYLKLRGRPRSAADLERHDLIGFVRPSTGKTMAIALRDRDGSPFEISANGPLRCSDDFLGCITLAREGAGIVQAYHFLVEADVAAGRLVPLLEKLGGRTRPFSLLMPTRAAQPLAVRLLADALVRDVQTTARG
jgi:DNA-binding transcriptional LysR family regulator